MADTRRLMVWEKRLEEMKFFKKKPKDRRKLNLFF